jgi:large subunit ribosomal protein L2
LDHEKKSAFSYIVYPKGLKLFDKLKTLNERKNNFYLRIGDASVLYNFEAGDFIHNVESIPGQGSLFARSAGTFCQILQNSSKDYAKIRLPSGSQRLISLKAKATLGVVGCEEYRYLNFKKAGRSR